MVLVLMILFFREREEFFSEQVIIGIFVVQKRLDLIWVVFTERSIIFVEDWERLEILNLV